MTNKLLVAWCAVSAMGVFASLILLADKHPIAAGVCWLPLLALWARALMSMMEIGP